MYKRLMVFWKVIESWELWLIALWIQYIVTLLEGGRKQNVGPGQKKKATRRHAWSLGHFFLCFLAARKQLSYSTLFWGDISVIPRNPWQSTTDRSVWNHEPKSTFLSLNCCCQVFVATTTELTNGDANLNGVGWPGKMIRWVKVLTAKPDDPSLSPKIHMEEQWTVLWLPHMYIHIYTYTYVNQ